MFRNGRNFLSIFLLCAPIAIVSSAVAASNPSLIPSLPSIAAMQSLGTAAPQYSTVSVTSYSASGLLGGGEFVWTVPANAPGGACTTDGGVVFAATGVSTSVGCYVRRVVGTNYLASWFGARGDGNIANATANTASVNAGIYSAQTGGYNFVFDQCGTYWFNGSGIVTPIPTVPPGWSELGYTLNITGCSPAYAFNAVNSFSRGTILAMDPSVNHQVFDFKDFATHHGSGNVNIHGLRFEATTTSEVIHMDVLTGYGSGLSNNEIIQFGTGNGIVIDQCSASTVSGNTIVGGAYLGGGTNTGIGISLQATYFSSTCKAINNIIHSFANAGTVGTVNGGYLMTAAYLINNEVSNNTNGWTIGQYTSGLIADNNYNDGAVTGTIFIDQAKYTKITNSYTNTCFATFIDSTATTTGGNVYSNNYAENDGTDCNGGHHAVTFIAVNDNSGSGNIGKTITGNTLRYSASGLSNIVGINLTGANPTIFMHDNNLLPSADWGSGSQSINNSFTGVITGSIQTLNNAIPTGSVVATTLIPQVAGATLGDTNVSGGVMTLSNTSNVFTIRTGQSSTVSSFAPTKINTGQLACFMFADNGLKFSKGSQITMMSATFPTSTAGGTICFLLNNISGTMYAMEISEAEY